MCKKEYKIEIAIYSIEYGISNTTIYIMLSTKDGCFSMFIVLNICCSVTHKILECLHGLIILCSLRGQCFRIYFNRLIFCEDDRKCSVKIGEVCGSQPHKILYLVLKNKKKYIKITIHIKCDKNIIFRRNCAFKMFNSQGQYGRE